VRSSTIIMIGVAAVFGLLAVFVAQSWLNSQAEARLKTLQANQPKAVAAQTLVVANRPLRFGDELSSGVLREVAWPSDAQPQGAFKTIQEALADGKRVVLTAIEANEPVLESKITGHGQRATLSAMIGDTRKAVTIRVNDVEGVAGFVLPGDRVDVMLSRQLEKGAAINDVVLKDVRVLAIDQLADERTDRPSVAKAVTLEVEILGAQKLALASQVGSLSLALRRAGDAQFTESRPVTLADLANSREERGKFTSVGITRGANRTVYSVRRESGDDPSTALLEHGTVH
jgi:pilus assembly protein CpaB